MEKLKQYVALTVAGCLAILAAGWFLLISPKKAEATALQEQAASQESTNASLRTQLEVLKAKSKDLPKQQAKLAAVAAKIPENPALPALIRALDSASAEAGVELVSIAPGIPTPVAAVAATVPVAPTDPAAPGAPAVDPAAPVAANALNTIPVAINVVGGYFEVQQFMSGLEGLSRALRVSDLSLAPGANPLVPLRDGAVPVDDGRTITATITGEVFLAAGATAQTPVVPVAPGAPAPGTPAAGVTAATTPAAPAN